MPHIFHNLASGTITDNPLSNVATTINSAAFANLPVVAAPDTLSITLDPDGVSGLPEIVVVTAHTGAATSVTVTRGQETSNGGAAAHSHPVGTVWRHTVTRTDLEELPYRKVTTKGDLLVATGDKATSRVAAGADTTRLVADSTQANGVRWAPATEQTLIDAKGDLLAGTADNTAARLAVGANGKMLVADSTATPGMKWDDAPFRRMGSAVPTGQTLTGTIADIAGTTINFTARADRTYVFWYDFQAAASTSIQDLILRFDVDGVTTSMWNVRMGGSTANEHFGGYWEIGAMTAGARVVKLRSLSSGAGALIIAGGRFTIYEVA